MSADSELTPEQKKEAAAVTQRVTALTPATATKPTLIYFPIRGIGWSMRCVLHMRDVDFDNVTVDFGSWGAGVKGAMFFGTMPRYVEPGGVDLNQSVAILNHLGRKYGMGGANEVEQALVDEVLLYIVTEFFSGLMSGLRNILVNFTGATSEDDWKKRTEEYRGTHLQTHISTFEKILDRNGNNGFAVGSSVTVADIYALNILGFFVKGIFTEEFPKHPKINEYLKGIYHLPLVQRFVASGVAATVTPPPLPFFSPLISKTGEGLFD